MDLGSENRTDGVEQLTGQELSPFLSLPREIRDIIYGYLLLLDTPIGLELGPPPKNGRSPTFKTRLGLFPPICRTSPQVAFECFAILFGQNTLRFGGAFNTPYCSLNGLDLQFKYWRNDGKTGNYYSYFYTTIIVDTFNPYCEENDEADWVCVNLLHIYRAKYPNLRKLLLNLAPWLQRLTAKNKEKLLRLKADVPKHAAIEFCGATPTIVEELTAAWSNYTPKNSKDDEHIMPAALHLYPEWLQNQIAISQGKLDPSPAGLRRLAYMQSLRENHVKLERHASEKFTAFRLLRYRNQLRARGGHRQHPPGRIQHHAPRRPLPLSNPLQQAWLAHRCMRLQEIIHKYRMWAIEIEIATKRGRQAAKTALSSMSRTPKLTPHYISE